MQAMQTSGLDILPVLQSTSMTMGSHMARHRMPHAGPHPRRLSLPIAKASPTLSATGLEVHQQACRSLPRLVRWAGREGVRVVFSSR